MISRNKILFICVLVIMFSPLAAVGIHMANKPDSLPYSLVYTEVVDSDIASSVVPFVFTYCFDVPANLKVEGDLQAFFLKLTGDDLKQIMLSDVTKIDTFSYKTSEGCGAYTAKIEAEDVRGAYKLYKEGNL